MKKITSILLALLFFFSTQAFGKITITLAEDPWPPFIVKEGSSSSPKGTAVQFLKRIFERVPEIEVKFVLHDSWSRLLDEVKHGKMDGIIILAKTAEREEYMTYSDSYTQKRTVFFYKKSRFPKGIKWNTYEDLSSYVIGGQRSSNYSNDFEEAIKNNVIKAELVTEIKQHLIMLKYGRIDLAAENEVVGNTFYKEKGWHNEIAIVEKPIDVGLYYMALSKKSPAASLMPKINKVIAQLKKEGVPDQIFNQ